MVQDDDVVASVVQADAGRAIARQSGSPQLSNHVGMRHAGALFSVGYTASRALVSAALAEAAGTARAEMLDSEVAYEKLVGDETVTATAEPAGEGWEGLLERLEAGGAVQLATSVRLQNEDGETVTAMSVSWRVAPEAEEPR